MKEALLIVRNFPPVRHGGTIRVEAFARHLPKYGFRPTILSSATPLELADSPDRVLPDEQRIELPWRLPKSFLRRQLGKFPIGYGLERQRDRRDLATRSVRACIDRGIRPAVVLASCPPGEALAIGQAISQHYGCPFVCDYRDPWSYSSIPPYPHWLDFRCERNQERQLLQRVSAATVTTQASRSLLEKKLGMPRDRIHLLPNGYELSEFEGAMTFEPIAAEPDCFHIVYTGDMESTRPTSVWTRLAQRMGFQYDPLHANRQARSPKWFLEGLERFIATCPERAQRVRVWFIGNAHIEHDPAVASFPFRDVLRIVPRVPPRVAIGALLQAQLLLLLQHETYLDGKPCGMFVAGKLYSYLASGQRILAGVQPSENSTLVDRFQAGATVSPTSSTEFAIALQSEFERWQAGGSPRAPFRPIPEFDRSNQTGQLAKLFESLISSPTDTPGHASDS